MRAPRFLLLLLTVVREAPQFVPQPFRLVRIGASKAFGQVFDRVMLCVCGGNQSLTVVALNRSRARQQAVRE
jgi:hypothetical protein